MTSEEIMSLAREAGFKFSPAQFSGVLEAEVSEFAVEHFAGLVAIAVAAKEREACAQVCDEWDDCMPWNPGARMAAKIRARGQA